jgi:acyl-coenzyme A synthetase/AMP-(fatty) acid ligase
MRTPDPSNESSKREDHNTPPLLASCQHLIRSNGVIVGREIADCIGNVYPTLASVIPPSAAAGTAFLASIDGRLPLKHAHVAFFLQEFGETLRSLGVKRGHRVALVLPNGPELALAILAVSQWACCVPLSATGAVSELKADLMRCGAHFVIGPYSEGPLPTNKSSLGTTLTNHDHDDNDNDAHLYHRNDNHHNHHNDAHLYHDNHHNHHDAHDNHHHDDYHNFTTTTTMTELKKLAETTRLMTDASSPDWTVHHHVQETAAELGIAFCGLVPDPRVAGPFRLVVPHKLTRSKLRQGTVCYDNLQVCPVDRPLVAASDHDKDDKGHEPNSGHDEALVLFTSGTTGNKKLVAHQMRDILVAATTIALSWQLKPTDTNCNLMPLFHVGGIVRQVYSPLISGGCVICCPSFDADLFWGLLQNKAFNWYYAAPTMHQIILQTGKALLGNDIRNKYQLKMIANAAGGLLPSLAEELRSTFQAAVLPSYGMTECMPISSPPANYDLGKPGTSGVPVGPQVAVLNLATLQPLEPMQEGPICVRGEPCFRGYGVLANDPKDTKPPETFLPDGWFNTGDLGYLDQDGYLYITGKSVVAP